MIGKWFHNKKTGAENEDTENEEKLGEKTGENIEFEKTAEDITADNITASDILEAERVNLSDTETRISYITHLYDQIKEAKKQCEDAKFDYGQATSYLKDIQLIDTAPEEQGKIIHDVAEGIYELNKERNRIQKQKYKITDAQRLAIESHEDKIDDDVRKLQEYENYMIQVKNDLRQLSSEKNMLLHDRKDIVERQSMLRILSKSVALISISMLALILTVYFCFEVEITYPFIGLVAFVFLALLFILYESGKNRRLMVITEKKCNRAVSLSNKVKIKYVNTTNVIDSICRRYSVRNGMELDFVNGQYKKAKRELKQEQESTKMLAKYNEILVRELQKLGVKDKEIWFYQAEALISDKEMVEVRHRLNTERQNLRRRLDYNADIMEKCLHEMEKVRGKSPEYEQDVENVLKDNG